ncbi:uncharacterized mitochondrial protein AtMg00810-like [Arachis duranensis]|uniref:Uncharacterized mitochondrial protein AtMg00810-like n=1 Tax=Arachis duranensis TaxID=130453 RepID=A0A6P4DJP4_ARADU|nr:uncharacterized mitochondrial protein AtMg00810-like [Arachis duranensis]
MKDLGSFSYFLSLEVISTNDGIYLTQAKYALDLLVRAGITDSHTEFTLLEPNVHFTPMDDTVLDNPTLYRQLVGGLVYLTVTRPDIAYPIHVLNQFLSAPRITHYVTVLREYSDADWPGDPSDRHSITGYCLFLGDSLILWQAKKQTFTARSSTEVEYHALANTTAMIAHNDVFHERTEHIEIDCHLVRQCILIDAVRLIAVVTLD